MTYTKYHLGSEPSMKRIRNDEGDSVPEQSATEQPAGDSAEPVKGSALQSGDSAVNTPGVANSAICRPGYISPKGSSTTKTYRKVNRFSVNINEHPTIAVPDEDGHVQRVCHVVPWRDAYMYMSQQELDLLHTCCVKYRYKRAGFAFKNFTTHTANIAGSPDPHLSVNYGGVLGFCGVADSESFGPWYSTDASGVVTNSSLVERTMSNANRSNFYREYPFHLSLIGHYAHFDTTNHTGVKSYPNVIDRAITGIGSLPISQCVMNMTDRRWRNSRFFTNRMGVNKVNGVSRTMSERPTGGLFNINSNYDLYGFNNPSVRRLGQFDNLQEFSNDDGDDIDPNVTNQISVFGLGYPAPGNSTTLSGAYQKIETTLRDNVDLFYFGFLVPLPDNATEPNVFISFEMETELEVEYVPIIDADIPIQNRNYHATIGSDSILYNPIGTGSGSDSFPYLLRKTLDTPLSNTASHFGALDITRVPPTNSAAALYGTEKNAKSNYGDFLWDGGLLPAQRTLIPHYYT